jgi:hypothetical protein
MEGAVAEHFEGQARGCEELGSPFTAALCRLLAERIDHSTRFGARILEWPGDPRADALSLRACGALHALARSGRAPALTQAYPPAPFEAGQLWAAIAAALAEHHGFLTSYLDGPPQTNEVARSSFILGAALITASLVRLPLDVLEIGASAGLNLAFDQYRYEFGSGRSWGSADAPLTIASAWGGDIPPLDAPLEVMSRSGCDRNPLDPTSPEDAARLLSYVWADQDNRLVRLESALQYAAASGRKVEHADAGAWLKQQLAAPAPSGHCRFVFHTVVRQYLPADVKARIDTALAHAGAAATADRPLAHFSFEGDGRNPGGAMTLTLWPGKRVFDLGRADYHGRWVLLRHARTGQ